MCQRDYGPAVRNTCQHAGSLKVLAFSTAPAGLNLAGADEFAPKRKTREQFRSAVREPRGILTAYGALAFEIAAATDSSPVAAELAICSADLSLLGDAANSLSIEWAASLF